MTSEQMESFYLEAKKQHIYELFRDNYCDYLFSLLPPSEPDWILQVLRIKHLLKENKKDFLPNVYKECEELNLPADLLDIPNAFSKAATDVEFMMRMAKHVVGLYTVPFWIVRTALGNLNEQHEGSSAFEQLD